MSAKKFLVRHVGNMGDMLFLVPPALETLKKKHPGCHITVVTAWGYKQKGGKLSIRFTPGEPQLFTRKSYWGQRNQGGFCISLLMTNPHIDQLVHYSDTELSLDGNICIEEGRRFPTWNKAHYETEKSSGAYDEVFELDFGLEHTGNPIQQMYRDVMNMPGETFSNYKLYFTDEDKAVAEKAMQSFPTPRIVLLEGIEGTTTRGWDPEKVAALEVHIKTKYGVSPIWFGGKYIPTVDDKPLTLRQNIATLLLCDVAIGVMSGPMHFAAAVGLPTIALYADHPLHRAAPAYFLNQYIENPKKQHRTIMGATNYNDIRLLKDDAPFANLTPTEAAEQGYEGWQNPGNQSKKSSLAVITPEEVLHALEDVI